MKNYNQIWSANLVEITNPKWIQNSKSVNFNFPFKRRFQFLKTKDGILLSWIRKNPNGSIESWTKII